MSKQNSIPEFFGILAGFMIVMSIIGVVIGIAYDKAKDKLKPKSKIIQSPNANQKLYTEIQEKPKKPAEVTLKKTKIKIAIVETDKNLMQKDPLRYMTGSPGETSRVLTNNYYSLFFDGSKTLQNAQNLLEYRNIPLIRTDIEMNENLIKILSEKYFNKVSVLIFSICCNENKYGQFDLYSNRDRIREVYKVVLEEHNKVCPIGQEEDNGYNYDSAIIEILKIISDSTHAEIEDEENYNDDFYKDEDYDEDEDNDNFDDVEINKENIVLCIDILENNMAEMIEEFIPVNPMQNTPLEGIEVLKLMNEISKEFKNELLSDKKRLGFTDREIEYIISKTHINVYDKYIDKN